MDQRRARRVVRAGATAFCRDQAEHQPDTNEPGDRARLVDAWRRLADYLDPGPIDGPLPSNLQPLVRPDGTTFTGWQRRTETEGDTDVTGIEG